MTSPENRSAEWYLFATAIVADVAGILAFVGFQADKELRLVVAGILALVGAFAGLLTLAKVSLLFFSTQGAYTPPGEYSKNLIKGIAALLISLALGYAFLTLSRDNGEPRPAPSSSSPSVSRK